ncbi:oligomeric Golgi complex subunit 6 [Lineolata rhizophorae]|uniref:Conserved oligomeric Golgi complex subunit 6 n=1 Tax=Lineolata rhizophorae TaxID=578093 RepID=A0A6A6P2A1_9PEZI|nr:oligomeric Golgi complex subunit 6 [Lineolata rhizophorae]
MTSSYFSPKEGSPPSSTPLGQPGGTVSRQTALSTRISAVLSASYSDLDIRNALETLDARGIKNTPETRRQLRLDVQREVIQCNGDIVKDFGQVAEQLRRIGTVIDKLNQTFADLRSHVNAADSATVPVLSESSTQLAQKSQTETKQRLLDAFTAHFTISEPDLVLLTSSAAPVDDAFFAVLARVKRIHADSQILLGAEHQTLGLEILEQSSRHLNAAFQKLFRWVQRELKSSAASAAAGGGGVDLEDNPHIHAGVRRALRVLAERPALFQSCLDFFAEAREHGLSDAFYTALTGAPPGGASSEAEHIATKPIEFHAHDPLRYVGDMLAWAHSATVSEREALEVLFIAEGDEIARGIQAGIESDPWLSRRQQQQERDGEEGTNEGASADSRPPVFDGRRALNELVARDLASVARLLRQRTEQVMQSHGEDATLAYRIANLVSFYRATFGKLIGGAPPSSTLPTDNHNGGDGATAGPAASAPGSPPSILDALASLEASALRHFRTAMRDHVAGVRADLSASTPVWTAAPAPADLAPPDFLDDALETLAALMRSYDGSLATTAAGAGPADAGEDEGFETVLREALDPFVEACAKVEATMPDPLSRNVFGLNCALRVRDVLAGRAFAWRARAERVVAAVDRHVDALRELQFGHMLGAAGAGPLFAALPPQRPGGAAEVDEEELLALLERPEFAPEALARAGQRLDEWLPSGLMDAVERLAGLRDRNIAQRVSEEAAERFCEEFERLEKVMGRVDEMVGRREGLEEREKLRDLLPRTSGEIRVLLS